MIKKLEHAALALGIILPASIPILIGIHYHWPEGVQVLLASGIMVFQLYYLSEVKIPKVHKHMLYPTLTTFQFDRKRQKEEKPLLNEILNLLYEVNPPDKIAYIKKWLLAFPSEKEKYKNQTLLDKEAFQIYNWHIGKEPLPSYCSRYDNNV